MASDDAAEQSCMGQMIQPTSLTITLSCRVNQCQIPRLVFTQEASFQRRGECLWMTRSNKSTARDCHAASDRTDCLVG
jgi:hypothetical protein